MVSVITQRGTFTICAYDPRGNWTYVIIRQYANDRRWDKTGAYDDHTADSEKNACVIWTEIDEIRQCRGGNCAVDRDTHHHENDRERWVTSAKSEGYNEDTLNARAYESSQFPNVRQTHSLRTKQPVAHNREEVREDHSEYMRCSCQDPCLNKLIAGFNRSIGRIPKPSVYRFSHQLTALIFHPWTKLK